MEPSPLSVVLFDTTDKRITPFWRAGTWLLSGTKLRYGIRSWEEGFDILEDLRHQSEMGIEGADYRALSIWGHGNIRQGDGRPYIAGEPLPSIERLALATGGVSRMEWTWFRNCVVFQDEFFALECARLLGPTISHTHIISDFPWHLWQSGTFGMRPGDPVWYPTKPSGDSGSAPWHQNTCSIFRMKPASWFWKPDNLLIQSPRGE